MLRGDTNGYLRPLTPDGETLERPLAEGAALAPLAQMRLELEEPSLVVGPGSTSLANVRVTFTFRYEGLPPDNIFTLPLRYDFANSKTLRITGSRLEDGANLPIWATGPIETLRSPNFLALHRPGLRHAAQTLEQAEKARSQLEGKITFPLESGYLLLMARDRAEYESLSNREAPISAIAQAETSFEVKPDSVRVLSRQIVVNLQKLFEEGEADETFRHELGHLALATLTRPFTPAWVSESAAMYMAGTRPRRVWKEGLRTGRFDKMTFGALTTKAALGGGDPTGEAATYEYAYSAAAAWYLVETFGAEKYFEFYKSYTDYPARDLYERLPGDRIATDSEEVFATIAAERTPVALRAIFGLSDADLDQKVRTWIQTTGIRT